MYILFSAFINQTFIVCCYCFCLNFCIIKNYLIFVLLAHLSQRLIGELIGYSWSGDRRRRCCPPFSNVFSSETTWSIKAKFYVEPPLDGGTKVYINGPGHMTKMAAMPIYGKNLKKSSPEPEVL